MRRINLVVVLLSVLIVSACGNKFIDGAREAENNNKVQSSKKEQEKENLEKEEKDIYESLEKPLDQVISENDLDERDLLEIKNVPIKDDYKDVEEFAMYVASILFKFQDLSISPDNFYEFLYEFGSKSIGKDMPDEKETAILIYSNVQSLYEQVDSKLEFYDVSTVSLSRNNREAYFYRRVTTKKGEEFYITTIVNEDNLWKFSDDSPSPPFEIKDFLDKGE